MERWFIQLVTATLGAFIFSLIFNVRGKNVIYTTLGGFLAWSFYLLCKLMGLSAPVGYLVVSVLITVYAEISARLHRAPATVYLVCAIIPLVPGSRLYATMVYAVHQDWPGFLNKGIETLLLAVAIAGGIIVVSTVMHAIHAARELKK